MPSVEVSWQITGIRKDAYADRHPIPVEEMKPERERGLYLHPDAFDQSQERGVQHARHAEAIRQAVETREKTQTGKQK